VQEVVEPGFGVVEGAVAPGGGEVGFFVPDEGVPVLEVVVENRDGGGAAGDGAFAGGDAGGF